jgi:arylamine N-acetyltransferase
MTIVGGSHWALMVYFRNLTFYLDSGSGGIILNAHTTAMRMKALL